MFRPTLECLEQREVYSVNPLTPVSFDRGTVSHNSIAIAAQYNGDANFDAGVASVQWDIDYDGTYEIATLGGGAGANGFRIRDWDFTSDAWDLDNDGAFDDAVTGRTNRTSPGNHGVTGILIGLQLPAVQLTK